MKKVLISILNKHFKNCLYSDIIVTKLYELVNSEYPITEIISKDDWRYLKINNTLIIKLKLSATNYISDIDVEEIS